MPGGWHYRQRLRSSPQRPQYHTITAETYDGLVQNVFAFRLNNIEIIKSGSATQEQVEHDIKYYVCGKYPHQCTGGRAELSAAASMRSPPPMQRGGRPGYMRPLVRIEDWLTILTEKTLKWVDQARAQERARICIECPRNQTWRTGCGSCNQNAERRAFLIRGSHATGLEPKLKSCISYGTLLDLSVWLENDHSAPNRQPPANCWKLTESQK
jgi:hypothetical protein